MADDTLPSGATHYDGTPCVCCGGTLRYTRNKHCVACNRARRARHREARAAEMGPHARTVAGMARAEARANGQTVYTGQPCPYGHGTTRNVSNGNCPVCAMAKLKAWATENADHVRAKIVEWRERNEERLSAWSTAYYRDNAERIKKRVSSRYEAKKDEIKRYVAEWKSANKDRVKQYQGDRRRNRRARLRMALGSHTIDDIQRLYELQAGHCAACSADFSLVPYEVDHIVAIASGGTNDAGNLQLLCGFCNRSKGTRDFQSWLAKKFQVRNGSD